MVKKSAGIKKKEKVQESEDLELPMAGNRENDVEEDYEFFTLMKLMFSVFAERLSEEPKNEPKVENFLKIAFLGAHNSC
ncbi:unnamed protein product [Caenorhabditis angaria]|uniref:Uncharacterized protein n=1 Tax=Caenorhabditis angaria TaxID=860376 RepID=A0A9P1MT78_9PELO|nr:unnamed protein product [Caenorhabditis angaria]